LDPKTLSKIRGLEVRARLIVEGFMAGQHKSPYQGFSVEFAQHREYAWGDDLRHLDWKVLGRTDKHYLKQYEEETNLVLYVVVDTSESMTYGSVEGVTKLDYASYIAASLAHLTLQQRDAVSLALFDRELYQYLKPNTNPAHLRNICHQLETSRNKEKTQMGLTLHELADRFPRRGIVLILSDCFDRVDEIVSGLKHLRYKRHDMILMNVMDPYELEFPFKDATLFEGLEEYPELLVEPRALRQRYLEEVTQFQATLKKGCRGLMADYVLMNTGEPLDVALSAYLATRNVRTR
jgi:uncharacterized protein (DUF58 family)